MNPPSCSLLFSLRFLAVRQTALKMMRTTIPVGNGAADGIVIMIKEAATSDSVLLFLLLSRCRCRRDHVSLEDEGLLQDLLDLP